MTWQAAKQLLKRSEPLVRLNAAWKNLLLERRARRISDEYRPRLNAFAAQGPVDVEALIASRMQTGSTRSLRELTRPPGIFLVGTYYEQESAGFIQALERAGRLVTLRTAAGKSAGPAWPGARSVSL